MTRSNYYRLGMIAIAVALVNTTAQAKVKKSISVAPTQWQAAATVGWISGEAITAQMITELEKSGRYRVVERENIAGVIGEQDLATAGRTRGGSSPKTGNIEGAQLQIKCVVTDAEMESGKSKNVRVLGIGGGKSKTIYRVTMDVRIYDMETSLILGTATVTAEQEKKSKDGGVNIGIISIGGGKKEGDTTGQITRDLIRKAISKVDEHANVHGWRSKIVKVKDDGKVVIRGGSRDGLETGMVFTMYQLGEQIIDEDTGEVLDEGEETEVGTLEITQVKDKVCYASKTSGQDAEKGFIVRLKD